MLSQPAGSLAGDFGYSRKWRHFRRLVAKSLVSGGEFWGFRVTAANSAGSLCSMIFQYPKFGSGPPRDRLRFRRDRFESASLLGTGCGTHDGKRLATLQGHTSQPHDGLGPQAGPRSSARSGYPAGAAVGKSSPSRKLIRPLPSRPCDRGPWVSRLPTALPIRQHLDPAQTCALVSRTRYVFTKSS